MFIKKHVKQVGNNREKLYRNEQAITACCINIYMSEMAHHYHRHHHYPRFSVFSMLWVGRFLMEDFQWQGFLWQTSLAMSLVTFPLLDHI